MVQNKLLRVAQMNAIYFDKEVQNAFRQQIQECLKHFPPGLLSKYDPEINFLLNLAILNYSVLRNSSTFGQKMLSIKYDNMTIMKKAMFVMSQCFEYLKDRLDLWKPHWTINKYLSNIDAATKFMQFINICIFLQAGTKPKLIERIFDINQVYSKENAQRFYEDKYMTRELLWNGLIEVLVYILPLINYHKITRTIRNLNPLRTKPTPLVVDQINMSPDVTCAQCHFTPVLPHHMGCAHVFCYYCLRGNQEADPKYECPICEYSSDKIICDRVKC